MLSSVLIAYGASFIDGRRPLIVPALFVLTLLLLCMDIAGCFTSEVSLWAIVVIMYLWALVYQISLGACGFVLDSSCIPR